MAYVKVYYRGVLKDEVELAKTVTTIGRGADCDVRIDNPAVSTHHARILCEGDSIFIEDNDSKNGVFVNGDRVKRRSLGYGDEITIFKHTLKLAAVNPGALAPSDRIDPGRQVDQGATVEMDVSQLDKLLKERRGDGEAYLLVVGASGQQRARHPLSRVSFKIGKAADSDLRVGGWLAPRVAARVLRKEDGYYLVPANRGKVRINGARTLDACRLEDGDKLSVRGLRIDFYHRQATD